MRSLRLIIVTIACLTLTTGAWAAEPEVPAEKPKPDADKPTKRAKKYRSAKRVPCEQSLSKGRWNAECEDEYRRDKVWQAQWKSVMKKDLKPEVHATEARRIATNNKHVIMAYSAIWLIVLGLFVMMWFRQSKLVTEIARLESDLKNAVDEDD